MRRRPRELVRRVPINRGPVRKWRHRRQGWNNIRRPDTKKPAAISDVGLLSQFRVFLGLMHQMVDHVSAAKQHRDTNQNRNKERHDQLLSVVRASKITLGEYSGFCMEPVGHHVLKWPSWSNRGPSSRRHDPAAVPRTMQAGQSTLFHGSGARIQRNENASHSPRRGIDLFFDDPGLGSGDRNHLLHPRRALARSNARLRPRRARQRALASIST